MIEQVGERSEPLLVATESLDPDYMFRQSVKEQPSTPVPQSAHDNPIMRQSVQERPDVNLGAPQSDRASVVGATLQLASSVLALAELAKPLVVGSEATNGVNKSKEATKNTEMGEVKLNPPVKMNFGGNSLSDEAAKHILGVVLSFPPKGDHAFNWSGAKDKLSNTQSIVEFADSRAPNSLISAAGGQVQGGVVANINGATALGDADDGSKIIQTQIYVDKIAYDEKGNKRSPEEIQARLMVTTAHEMYGNHTLQLKAIQEGKDLKNLSRKDDELASFQAGIDFIDRFEASPQYQQISPELQKALQEARKREVAGLESWKNAPDDVRN